MYAFDIPRNFIAVLGALVLTLALSAVSSSAAYAQDLSALTVTEEMSTIEGLHGMPVFSNADHTDTNQLRHLLSQPNRSIEEQRQLERSLNDLYEELADAGSNTLAVFS